MRQVQLCFRVPAELRKLIRILAIKKDTSESEVVRMLLTKAIKK